MRTTRGDRIIQVRVGCGYDGTRAESRKNPAATHSTSFSGWALQARGTRGKAAWVRIGWKLGLRVIG